MVKETKKHFIEDYLPKIIIILISTIISLTALDIISQYSIAFLYNVGLIILGTIISGIILLIAKKKKIRVKFYFERFLLIWLFEICLFFMLSIVVALITPSQNMLISTAAYFITSIIIAKLSEKKEIVSWCKWFFPYSIFVYFAGIIAFRLISEINQMLGYIIFASIITIAIILISVMLLGMINKKLLTMTNTIKYIKAFSRRYSTQYCEQALLSLPKCVSSLVIPDNKNESYYFKEEEYNALIEEIELIHTSSDKRFEYYSKAFHTIGKQYVNFCKKVSNQKLFTYSDTKLKETYITYQKVALGYAYFVWTGHLLATHWREIGKNRVEDERVLNPVKKNTLGTMQQEALSIKTEEDLVTFWKKYQWLPCLDLWNEPWTIKDAKNFVENSSPIETKPAPTTSDSTIKMIQELGYIMDARDDYRRQAIFYIQPFFREIAKRKKLTLKQLAFFTTDEILSLLGGSVIKIDPDREDGFLMYLKNKKINIQTSSINQKLNELGFFKEKNTGIVTGTVACKGKAKGVVKIVKTIHDIIKVEKGDILVSPMTHPDYVIAMRKASAIVTDEGGLLSHAAIVARELNIPCIVGTKNATKVLEHGSMVEVDAEKGEVKTI